jgi:hypothetical protein
MRLPSAAALMFLRGRACKCLQLRSLHLSPAVTHLGREPLSWMLTGEPARNGLTRPEPRPVASFMLTVNDVCDLQYAAFKLRHRHSLALFQYLSS